MFRAVLALGALLALLAPFLSAQAGSEEQELLRLADRVAGEVEALQGLRFLRPIGKGVYTQEELAAFVRRELDKEFPERKVRGQEQGLKAVGLLPPECAIKETLIRVLLGQIGGFYDPESGTFRLLAGRVGKAMNLLVMAHELAHALDDQHFDLEALSNTAARNSDAEFAAGSVAEGSATILQLRYMLRAQAAGELDLADLAAQAEREKEQAEAFLAEPPFFTATLLPRYTLGMAFLAGGRLAAVREGRRRETEAAFLDPPRSSEQILHPEKYWDPEQRDDPVEVILPPAVEILGEGWRHLDQDTLGEILCALLARPASFRFKVDNMALATSSRYWTNRAGEGWGGDRLGVFEDGRGGAAAVWCSAWDTAADAAEFLEAYLVHRKNLPAASLCRGRVVVMVFGPAPAAAAAAAERALAGVRFRKAQAWQPE